jgi:hypothetical protein
MIQIKRKNDLLYKLRNKELTEDEFIKECAKWVAEDVNDYSFKPIPEKPKEVEDFERIPENSRRNIDGQYYYDHPQILPYYHLRTFVEQENKALYDWLKDCVGFVDTEEEKANIIKKMGEYY